MFSVIFSFTLFLPKPIRTIRFLVKYSFLLQNRSVEFYLNASFPTSRPVLTSNFCFRVLIWIQMQSLVSKFLSYSKLGLKLCFRILIWIWIWSFLSNFCFNSNLSSKLDSRILIPIRFLSFVSQFLFEFIFKLWFSIFNFNSHSKFRFRILIRNWIQSFVFEFLFFFEFKFEVWSPNSHFQIHFLWFVSR